MTTKLINFFITSDDLPDIAQFILKRNFTVFKPDNNLPKTEGDYDIVQNRNDIFQVYLSGSEASNSLYFEHLDTKKKYYIDIIKSYCIEFSIGGFYPYSKSEFHRSRLYYVLSYFDSGHIVHKSKEFIQAADGFFNDFRKEFLIKEPKYTNDFVSKRFIDWIHKKQPKKTIDGTKFLI